TGLGNLLRSAGYRTWYGGKVHWPVKLTPERLGFTDFCRDERERLAVETAALIHREAAHDAPWAIVSSLINPHDICYQAIRTFAPNNDLDRAIIAKGQVENANLDEALQPPPGVSREDFLAKHLPPLPANWDI